MAKAGGRLTFLGRAIILDGKIKAAGGGAIGCGNGTTVELTNSTLTGNQATKGGGVYVDSNSIFNMHGGTIKNNISSQGKGVYVAGSPGGMYDQDGSFIMGGKACVGEWENDTLKDGNDVYLAKNNASGSPACIKIDKDNPITESKVACIWPYNYGDGILVLMMTEGTSVANHNDKFTVKPSAYSWKVDSDGKLKRT